jgi:hypothetical protein
MGFDTSHIGGATSKIVKVQGLNLDGTAYTTGAYNTSGLTVKYIRDGAAAATITQVTATAGTYTSSGFVHTIDGIYEIGAPTAALAAGADGVVFAIDGIADVNFIPTRVELTGVDPRSADPVDANVATLETAATDAIAAAVNDDAIARLDGYVADDDDLTIDGTAHTITRHADGYITSIEAD